MKVSDLYLSVIQDVLLKRNYTIEEVNDVTVGCLAITFNRKHIHVHHLGAITAISISEYISLHNIQKALDRETRIDKILN